MIKNDGTTFCYLFEKTKSPRRIKKVENEFYYFCHIRNRPKREWLFTTEIANSSKKSYLNNFWSKKAPILISARSTDDECNIHMTNEVCLEFHENCGAKCNHFEYNMNWIPCMESCFDLTILECSWKYSSGNSLLHNLLSHVLNSGKKNDYYCVTEVKKSNFCKIITIHSEFPLITIFEPKLSR